MLWQLVLAHFLADYPLQPERIARNKQHVWALLIHVGIHLLVMLALVMPYTRQALPYLVGISAVHLVIDALKTRLNLRRPEWTTWPYLIDQAAHLLTLALFSRWILAAVPGIDPYLSRSTAVAAAGFLLVTHVFLISERVITNSSREVAPGLAGRVWLRLVLRGALLAAFLLGLQPRWLALAGLASPVLTSTGWEDARVLLADLLFTAATAALVLLINSQLM